MDNSLAIALGITVIGMTLLFLALFFFYGLMWLITAVIKDPASTRVEADAKESGRGEDEALLQAAAIAVTLARAQAEQGAAMVGTEATGSQPVSPWWVMHHQREMVPSSQKRRAL